MRPFSVFFGGLFFFFFFRSFARFVASCIAVGHCVGVHTTHRATLQMFVNFQGNQGSHVTRLQTSP